MFMRARRLMDRIWASIWVRIPLSLFRQKIDTGPDEVIITLTSYPGRIDHVYLTLRSLLMQSLGYSKILLVLSLEEFPMRNDSLPRSLRHLIRNHPNSLQIEFTQDNKKSFKKLLPALELYPESVLITVDDDVIYWRSFASTLYRAHKANERIIIGTRGTQMLHESGGLAPYISWPQARYNEISSSVFLTGRGGVLYPPHSLNPQVLDWTTASLLCPNGDDIWFKAMAILSGTESLVTYTKGEYPDSGASQILALWRINVDLSENDEALRNTFEHFKIRQ